MRERAKRTRLVTELRRLRRRVTELEAAESQCSLARDALRESRRTLSTLLRNLPGMAYRCANDPDWTMEFVSEGCLPLTGYAPSDLVGNRTASYAELIHREDRGRVWDEVQKALESRQPFRTAYRIRSASGEVKWLWEQGVGVFDESGRLVALEGFITDITERVRAEEELEQHRDRLEELVFSRTADLGQANERLAREVQQRRQAEEAMRESQRRVRAIFDQTFQFIGLLTPDGIIVEVNRTALRFIEAEASEVLGKPFWETPWWTHSPELQDRLREAVKSAGKGNFERFEATHSTPKAELRTIDFSLKPVRDEDGHVVFLIPEGRDITDRKQAEERLRESEARLQAILDNAPAVIYLKDTHARYLLVNRRFNEIFHLQREEVVGRTDYDLFPDEIADRFRNNDLKVLISEAALECEEVALHDDGPHDYLSVKFPLADSAGEVYAVCGISSDITDLKRAETLLRGSEDKYRTLVENAPLVVYRTLANGEILFVSRFVQEVFGYAPAELLDTPQLWQRRVHPEDRDRVLEFWGECLRTGREFAAEYRIVSRDGGVVHVVDHAIPTRDPEGRVVSVDGILMDVTERVQLEQQLVRTKELETVGEVSARLAHEFRNPLVSIGGFARRLLSETGGDDPRRPWVEIIARESERLEAILQTVLTYIRPLELHPSSVEPTGLVEAAVGQIREAADRKGVRLHLDLDRSIPALRADGPQMERVVEALLRNALRGMEEGQTLSVHTWRDQDLFRLALRYPVRNVAADDVEDFFYPFTAAGVTDDLSYLPLSKLLVDKHGGTIGVRLEEAREMVVELALPL